MTKFFGAKIVLFSMVFAPIFASAITTADSPSCVLEKTVGGSGLLHLLPTSNGALSGALDSVSAEVDTYENSGGSKYIEGMTLTDSTTGISSIFTHNAQTTHNESPQENVDIQAGTLYMNLGVRGIYRLRCVLIGTN